jgi:hypothetical protein
VEPVLNVFPHAQTTVASNHFGWIFSFTGVTFRCAARQVYQGPSVPHPATCASRQYTIRTQPGQNGGQGS